MASRPLLGTPSSATSRWLQTLNDPARSVGGPMFDALLLWGIPLIAYIAVALSMKIVDAFPGPIGNSITAVVLLLSAVLTYAHLVAVAPRAYLNREVFETHRLKLTIVPPLLLIALVVSPTFLVVATVAAVFWDIHHSAMQNFGLGRIYDAKAGNDAETLREVDLGLNWFLYVGPLVAGASLMWHVDFFKELSVTSLAQLAVLPGILGGEQVAIKIVGIIGWTGAIAYAVYRYRQATRDGYRLPAHKAALIATTGLVSLAAWGFSSPLVAIASINIYHAIQYFALVWLKEGHRMSERVGRFKRHTLAIFLGSCLLIGLANSILKDIGAGALLAPFVACSLLHFWFDGFVWSVRRKHV